MSGNYEGGLKAKAKNLAKDPEYYSKLGKRGAQKYIERQMQGTAVPRGFAADRELARRAGQKGGYISRRKPAKPAN